VAAAERPGLPGRSHLVCRSHPDRVLRRVFTQSIKPAFSMVRQTGPSTLKILIEQRKISFSHRNMVRPKSNERMFRSNNARTL
jgi:hypothetical protein